MISPRILLLALGTFAIGTEGYVLAGLLPAVAQDLHVSVAACGQLVTVFALAYALAGPPLVAWLAPMPRKPLLIGALLGFAAANLLAAIAASYVVLVAARLLAAMMAALFMAPSATAAVALAPPEKKGHALSITATGNALSLAAGAPIGTMVGALWGWRWAFVLVALLSIAAALGLALALPAVPKAASLPFRARFGPLRRSEVRRGLATTFGLFVAALTAYTYLTPLAGAAGGFNERGVAALMVVFGATATVAGFISGTLLARVSARTVLLASVATIAALLSIIAILATRHRPAESVTVTLFVLAAVWGTAWWSAGIAQQHRLTGLAPDQHASVLALHYSLQYLGIAAGGAIGGMALLISGPAGVALSASAIACVTLTTLPVRRA